MTIQIQNAETGIIGRIKEMSGVDIRPCLQCKRCSNGCPVAQNSGYSPSEIIRGLQLGMRDDLLDSDMIWMCVSCAACYGRCPMNIDMPSVIDALRVIAEEKNRRRPEGNMPFMNRVLLGTIRTFGRTYDLGAMALYKMRTSSYLRDTGKFPMILAKRKIALLPPKGADKKTVKRIFKNLKSARKK